MTFNLPALKGAGLARRIRGMFNLNDPRWGRGGESGSDGDKPEAVSYTHLTLPTSDLV